MRLSTTEARVVLAFLQACNLGDEMLAHLLVSILVAELEDSSPLQAVSDVAASSESWVWT